MSQERVIKALRDLGLSDLDAKVYIFLGKKGLQKGQDIARSLKVHKQQVYRSLKNLQEKGIVSATLDHPACYSAEPFQKVIDLFIRAKMEEAQHLRQSKDAILSDWQSIVISENGSASEKFTVIKGRNIIYSKIQQMIQQTKKELSTITSIPYLVQADQFGLFDTAFGHPMKDSIQLRFLTELSTQDAKTLKKLLKRTLNQKLLLKVRVHDLGLKLPNRMVIRDDEEAIFFINTNADSTGLEQDDVCLWTNSKSLVNSFSAVFEDLWETSIELEKRIVEIETGKPSPKTCVISDAELALRKYQEILHSAKEEIIIMTSPEGLVQERESLSLLKDWASRGLSVKIMAPIVNENLQAAQDLSICSEVRHISPGYPEITVVDGKHIFQFKKQLPDEKGQKKIPYFGNTFYSNDFEYVERTRSLMNDIWRGAFVPSAITLESINKPAAPAVVPLSENEYAFSRVDSPYKKTVHGIDEKTGVLTEKDVLNQIINAKKYPGKNWPKDIVKYYGSNAMAIIHPPDYLNLPDMMLWLLHYNKQSSFGAEDFLLVYVWLETAQGYAYVPATLITDNPKSVEFWKTVFAGTPAGQNIRLVKKGELQMRIHSNIFFAGWTVSVPLLPPKYTLPPSSILFEGYSKLKSGHHLEYAVPSGVKVSVDSNGFDAFVTFFHPSTKYSGPGTDGVIGRDTITTLHPP